MRLLCACMYTYVISNHVCMWMLIGVWMWHRRRLTAVTFFRCPTALIVYWRVATYSRAVNVQSLQPEIAHCNYQNTAYSSRRTSNLLQNHNDFTNVPHKILFHDTWCTGCNALVSLHDSKNTILSPSNWNECIIHDFQRNGVKKCTKKRFISNKIIKWFKQCISKHPGWRPHCIHIDYRWWNRNFK